MITISKVIEGSNINIKQLKSFDENIIDDAKIEFKNKKDNKIIISCEFEDNIWRLSNGTKTFLLNFEFDEITFLRESNKIDEENLNNNENKTRDLGTFDKFINACKIFFLYEINGISVSTVSIKFSLFRDIMNNTDYLSEEKITYIHDKDCTYISSIIKFINFYELEVSKLTLEYLEALNENTDICKNNKETNAIKKRTLRQMESIFKFYEYIDYFWVTGSEDEKETFYPIKLWWEITMRIPLRVTEFLLTSYNCTRKDGNKYYFIATRSNLKGNSSKTTTNILEFDYYTQEVPITKDMYLLIEEYKCKVDKYDHMEKIYFEGCAYNNTCETNRSYLLSKRSYILKLKDVAHYSQKKFIDDIEEIITWSNMYKLLKRFYKQIFINQYKLIPVDNDSYDEKDDKILKSNEIEFINLMDTRHYSLINMVLNDINPLIMMKFTGHSKVSTTYNYYNYVDKFVECYTYNMAKKLAISKKSTKDVSLIKFDLEWRDEDNIIFDEVFYCDNVKNNEKSFKRVKLGKCYSQQTEYEDCIKHSNKCKSCSYLKEYDINDMKKIIDKEIDDNFEKLKLESEELKYLIKNYDYIINAKEKIALIINKIKGYSNENAYMIYKSVDME